MANEVADALRTAAEKVAQYIQDAGTLQVSTGYVQVGAKVDGDLQFDVAGPVASTVIKLDGDCKAVVPMRVAGNGTLELDTALLELHQRNVDTAIEYRARMLQALLGALQTRAR